MMEAYNNPFKKQEQAPKAGSEAPALDELDNVLQEAQRTREEVSGVRRKPRSRKQDKYTLESTGHAFALKYAPEFLGAGGDNVVYDIPGRPDIVVKGSTYGLYQTLALGEDSVNAETVEDSLLLMDMREELKKDGELRGKLFSYFGREHVLPQKRFLMKVPVTKTILDETERKFKGEFYSESVKKDVDEAWTIVTIQRKLELLSDQYVSASTGVVEVSAIKHGLWKDKEYMKEYHAVSDALVSGQDENISVEDIAFVIKAPGLLSVVQQAEKDPEFKTMLQDFVEKAIAFAEDTGEMLDIAGRDNVVFLKEQGAWSYKLLDPTYPFADGVLTKAREVYGKPHRSNKEWNILLQGLNFVRGLNAMAKISGSKKRLAFLPKEEMTLSVKKALFG